MRVVVFFVYLFFHLLCGSKDLHAGVHQNRSDYPISQNAPKHKHVKFTNTDQGIFVIGDTDLEVNEEYAHGDDVHDAGSLFVAPHGLLSKWYLSYFALAILSDQHEHFDTFPSFSGNSSPIYITQRVLRI